MRSMPQAKKPRCATTSETMVSQIIVTAKVSTATMAMNGFAPEAT